MNLTSEQRHNLQIILGEAKRRGAGPKATKAAVETALVEANLQNPKSATDHDSLGAFQQRPSQGWGSPKQVTNVKYATNKFLDQAIPKAKKYGSAGQLSQATQRSAFPARYDQHGKEAEQLIRGVKGKVGPTTSSVKTVTPGVDNSQARKAVISNYIQTNPNSSTGLFNTLLQLKGLQDTPGTTSTKTAVSAGARLGKLSHNPQKAVIELGKLAQHLGLHVGENPHFGGVNPVHVADSYHYKGEAIDVSGDPAKEAKYAKLVKQRYLPYLKELFYRGPGAGLNVKNGRKVGRNFVGEHTDHVHVAT